MTDDPDSPAAAAQLDDTIDVLGLSTRPRNALERDGIRTIGDLVKRCADDLLDLRNFGDKCLAEIELALAGLGLSLAAERMPYEPSYWRLPADRDNPAAARELVTALLEYYWERRKDGDDLVAAEAWEAYSEVLDRLAAADPLFSELAAMIIMLCADIADLSHQLEPGDSLDRRAVWARFAVHHAAMTARGD